MKDIANSNCAFAIYSRNTVLIFFYNSIKNLRMSIIFGSQCNLVCGFECVYCTALRSADLLFVYCPITFT